jgi:protein required for attachment to host cells
MSDLLISHGEWVVVCDGAKALLLENTGNLISPKLRTVEALEQKVPATHDIGADAPGRSHSSVGHGRSAVEQTDWHDQAEQAFIVRLAEYLDTVLAAGKTKSFIIVAPPRALSVLRSAYSHALKAAVRAEVDRDLLKLPVDQIAKHLTGS